MGCVLVIYLFPMDRFAYLEVNLDVLGANLDGYILHLESKKCYSRRTNFV